MASRTYEQNSWKRKKDKGLKRQGGVGPQRLNNEFDGQFREI